MKHSALQLNAGILSTISNTPMIALKRVFPDLHFNLYAKLELLNPGGSSKDRTALSLLGEALDQGQITSASTIVESSSGNLGIGIAQFCAYMGLRFICVVDSRATPLNLKIMEAYGAEIEMVRDEQASNGDLLGVRIERVKQLCAGIPGSFWPNQYANPANASAHRGTMCEIYEGLGGHVDYVFAATSTCGTLRGCAEFVTSVGADTRVIAVDAEGSVIFGGAPGRRLIPGHGASRVPELYRPHLEYRHIKVTDLDCVTGCYRLLHREAIFAGGSSGGVISAIAAMRDQIPEGANCAAILCDRGDRYLDTVYSRKWVAGTFGEIAGIYDQPPGAERDLQNVGHTIVAYAGI
jgi:cysteine synthase A